MKLAALTPAIAGNQGGNDLARLASFAQQLYPVDAVIGIDQRLRRDAANAGGNVRHARADREKPGRNRNADLAG